MSRSQLPSLPCLCASLRRGARALTQMYEQGLRPLAMTSTQLTVLQALDRTGEIPQRKLGTILAMDSTTLTRTLRIMTRHRWVSERRGKDRRERWLRLGRAGEAQLKRALPAWEQMQSQARRQLGDAAWDQLFSLVNRVAEFASAQSSSQEGSDKGGSL